MNANNLCSVIRTAVLGVGLLTTAVCFAHGGGGGGGGGWHGGGGGWHGGGGDWHGGGGGWHGGGGGWHGGGGGWHGGGWVGPGVVIGVPGYYGYRRCPTVQVCNNYGNCWWQRSCNY